jgi:hypothetical protein
MYISIIRRMGAGCIGRASSSRECMCLGRHALQTGPIPYHKIGSRSAFNSKLAVSSLETLASALPSPAFSKLAVSSLGTLASFWAFSDWIAATNADRRTIAHFLHSFSPFLQYVHESISNTLQPHFPQSPHAGNGMLACIQHRC